MSKTLNDVEHRFTSAWTTRQKACRVAWAFTQATFFRISPQIAYAWRAMLLRLFGAKIGKNARIRATARIEIPWNLTIGDNALVGDYAILYCLGKVTIGNFCTISQYSHLCAGTHDYRRPAMPLLTPPIVIGENAWICADAFVGPGVTIGSRAVLGARASAFSDIPPNTIAVGNPAKPVKEREPDISE